MIEPVISAWKVRHPLGGGHVGQYETGSSALRFVSAHCSSGLPDDQRHAVTRLCKAVSVKRGSDYTWMAHS
jgi:hypothetical protein